MTAAISNNEPTLSTAAIAFIALGGIFFVVLVILLFVLFACLFPRNSIKKTFIPTAIEPGSKLIPSAEVDPQCYTLSM